MSRRVYSYGDGYVYVYGRVPVYDHASPGVYVYACVGLVCVFLWVRATERVRDRMHVIAHA